MVQLVTDEGALSLSEGDVARVDAFFACVRLAVNAAAGLGVEELIVPDERDVIAGDAGVGFEFGGEMVEAVLEGWESVFGAQAAASAMGGYVEGGEVSGIGGMGGGFIFEDVGVTAYSGAAGLISAAGVAAGYLTAASGILAVEAYHAAYVRTYLTAQAISNSSYAYLGYANKVSALRATLGGSNETTLTVPTGTVPLTATTTATPSAIVAATSANAIAYARNTDQVLHIVYGTAGSGAGVKSGGFFPSGLNGNITVTQS